MNLLTLMLTTTTITTDSAIAEEKINLDRSVEQSTQFKGSYRLILVSAQITQSLDPLKRD